MKKFNFVTFTFILQSILIVLKLLGIFTHSWILILLPAIIYLSLLVLILALLGLGLIMLSNFTNNNK